MNEAGGIGRGVGLEGDEVRAPIAFAQPGRQFPQDGDELRFGLGGHGPNDGWDIPVALRDPLPPCTGLFDSDEVAPPLMENRHRNDQVLLSGDLDHGIDLFEVGLVGG